MNSTNIHTTVTEPKTNQKLHIVMPMCGKGSRFVNEGITIPKPLLYANSYVPMFYEAVRYITKDIKITNPYFNSQPDLILIGKPELLSVIKSSQNKFNNNANICDIHYIEIEEDTLGAADTVKQGLIKFYNDNGPYTDEPFIVLDCDTYIDSPQFGQIVSEEINRKYSYSGHSNVKGILTSFESHDPRYSYAVPTSDRFPSSVRMTAEKIAVSNCALTGAYYFDSTVDFIIDANKLINEVEAGKYKEAYMSLVYNIMLRNKQNDVLVTRANKVTSLGTPEEMFKAFRWMKWDGVITDLDGTLVDTFEANYLAYSQVFKEFGINFTEQSYKQNFGLKIDKMLEALGLHNITPQLINQIKARKAELYPEYFDKIKLNVGLYQRLFIYKKLGIPVVLATTASSKNVYNILDYFELDDFFDYVITGEHVSHGKPNPECYTKATELIMSGNELSTRNPNILVFEDSPVGMNAAWLAGLSFEKITIK